MNPVDSCAQAVILFSSARLNKEKLFVSWFPVCTNQAFGTAVQICEISHDFPPYPVLWESGC